MGSCVIICSNCLGQTGLEVFDFGLKHDVAGLTALLFEFVEFFLFFFVLCGDGFVLVLNAKIFFLFLLKFSRVVVNLSLESLKLRFIF